MSKRVERLLAFAFGVTFVSLLLLIATQISNPTPFQYTVFRIVLALAAGGVAAMIPGFITVEVSTWVRAGGALAVFVVVFFFSPAEMAGVKAKSDLELEIEKPILAASGTSQLRSVVVTRPDQLSDPQLATESFQSVTFDGVKAKVPSGFTIVANEIAGLGGASLVGTDFSVVARRLANLTIDVSAARPDSQAGTVRIYAKLAENLRVFARGAAGNPGTPGERGSDGKDGANGRNGNCGGFGAYRAAQRGGDGGDAGNGKNGEPGGDGGKGGLVVLATLTNPIGSVFETSGGSPGLGGAGGTAGMPGRAGTGGRGCVGLGGSQQNAVDGQPGKPGKDGDPGPNGQLGPPGEYRLLLVKSFDEIVSKLHSLPRHQLHSALADAK